MQHPEHLVALGDDADVAAEDLAARCRGGGLGPRPGDQRVDLAEIVLDEAADDVLSVRLPGAHLNASGGQINPATVARLPVVVRHDVFFAIAHAIDGVFIWALPAMVLAFVVARDSATAPDKAAAAVPELVR